MPLLLDVLLLDSADFVNFRDISQNIDDGRINTLIREAQIRELRSFLGDELYLKLISDYDENTKTFTDPRFDDIYYGVDYTVSSKIIRFNGLKAAHIMYTYKRLIDHQQVNVTRYGVKDLTTDDSESTTMAKLRAEKIDSDAMALMYESDAKKFLTSTTGAKDFPEWVNKDQPIKNTGFNFIKV